VNHARDASAGAIARSVREPSGRELQPFLRATRETRELNRATSTHALCKPIITLTKVSDLVDVLRGIGRRAGTTASGNKSHVANDLRRFFN